VSVKRESRTKLALLSGGVSFAGSFTIAIIKFFTRGLFLYYLSVEFLGINSLFAGLIASFNIVEIGIGPAIGYAFFKPLATHNVVEIRAIQEFCKKVYLFFGVGVICLAFLVFPFLPYILKDDINTPHIYLIYWIFALQAILSYFLRGKRPILAADQKQYIIAFNQFIFEFGCIFLQLAALIFLPFGRAEKFVIYISLYTLCIVLQELRLMLISNKMYAWVNEAPKTKIPKRIVAKMKKQSAGVVIGRVCGLVNTGLDNILLGIFTNITQVGLYANYVLITNVLSRFWSAAISAVSPGFGLMVASESTKKAFDVFKKYYFFTFFASIIMSNVILVGMNPLIHVWIGDEYCFYNNVPLLLAANFGFAILLNANGAFIGANGMQWEIKWASIFGSVINFASAMVCFNILHLGIESVLISTAISNIACQIWYPPKLLFEKYFKLKFSVYFRITMQYLSLTAVVWVGTLLIVQIIPSTLNGFIVLFGRSFLALIIALSVVVLFYHQTEEFKFWWKMVRKITQKVQKKFTFCPHKS
jgi:O-antigen/teichoic acid export membrane protein